MTETRSTTFEQRLTPRELQVVELVCEGKLNKEIAYELGTSEGTIKGYMHTILIKAGLRNRTELALLWRGRNPFYRLENVA